MPTNSPFAVPAPAPEPQTGDVPELQMYEALRQAFSQLSGAQNGLATPGNPFAGLPEGELARLQRDFQKRAQAEDRKMNAPPEMRSPRTKIEPTPASMKLSKADREYLIRTVIGEAAGEPPEGQRAVADVVLNRARASGKPVRDVVTAPHQFEPWQTRRSELLALSPDDPRWTAAEQAVNAATEGTTPDPTGGATHFLNKALVQQRGDSIPPWAAGDGVQIGNHTFFGGQAPQPVQTAPQEAPQPAPAEAPQPQAKPQPQAAAGPEAPNPWKHFGEGVDYASAEAPPLPAPADYQVRGKRVDPNDLDRIEQFIKSGQLPSGGGKPNWLGFFAERGAKRAFL